MQTFQEELAARLLDSYSNDLSQLVVMFPSLRARSFFNDAVRKMASHPIWQPKCTTIDQLMERGSNMVIGDRIRLITELYGIYKRHHKSEKFDRFYHWGEMLISDFDMIDKYMVDASMLLRNITDIKEIEADVSYMTKEQQEMIARFWSSVHSSETLSDEKQNFLKVWRSLPSIYTEYREHLKCLGIGYPGLLYRTTAERIERKEMLPLDDKRYIVAGFNALSKSERILFDYLAKSDKGAEFYWDYDSYYVDNKEHNAGHFMRQNLKEFGHSEQLSHNNLRTVTKNISSTACVSNIAQVKHLKAILDSIPAEQRGRDTAIVLTDETLLIPLLHSLPKELGEINVTMGYPLKNTLIYSFIDMLISLQTHSRVDSKASSEECKVVRFYHQDVTWLLAHPYIIDCCGKRAADYDNTIVAKRMVSVESTLFANDSILSRLFIKPSDWLSFSHYLTDVISIIMQHLPGEELLQLEYLRIASEEITKLARAIEKCNAKLIEIDNQELTIEVFTSLLRRHLQSIAIPFEGTPLKGLQVLGILETRNIDFKNVIILSMTDANFPGKHSERASFIPYSLREAYELPTPDQQEAMYAYYFYRLIQRAERVSMLYCSRADEKSTGECSRYIYQLDFESPYNVEKYAVGVDLSVDSTHPIEVAKGEREMAILNRYTDPESKYKLSPTALFRYVECPLKFYFASIARLRSQNELTDKIDAMTFGNILHESMELLYGDILDKPHPKALIMQKQDRETVEQAVDQTISKILYNGHTASKEEYSGDTLLVRDIIVKYILRGIMRHDISHDDYTISGLEKEIPYQYRITSGQAIKLAGRADRIDRLSDGTIQVIDYKSGYHPHLEYLDIHSLFHGESQQRISNIFQTLLYSMILYRSEGVDTMPSLFYASRMLDSKYSPLITEKLTNRAITRYSMIATEFEAELTATLDELFDPSVPFRQVEDKRSCENCDYTKICRRQNEQK